MVIEITYATVCSFLKNETNLNSIVNCVKGVSDKYQYKGFSHEAILAKVNEIYGKSGLSEKDFMEDLITIISLAHLRGPKAFSKILEKISEGEDKKRLVDIRMRWNLKEGERDASVITLPRLCIVFPEASRLVFQLLKNPAQITGAMVNYPGTEEYFPSHVAAFIDVDFSDEQALILELHLLYQTLFTKAISIKKDKSLEDCFYDALKFADLNITGSKVPSVDKVAYIQSGERFKLKAVDVQAAYKKTLRSVTFSRTITYTKFLGHITKYGVDSEYYKGTPTTH